MSSGYYALPVTIFRPAMRMILSITRSFPAVITTTLDGINPGDNQYVTGTVVRIDIAPGFGMPQIDHMTGTITVLTSSTFSIDIDTTTFQSYTIPSPLPVHLNTFSQVVPIGSANGTLNPAVQNVLPLSAN